VIDITGGAPELNPNLAIMLEKCARLAPRVMLRSNLTAITGGARDDLIDLCCDQRIVIVASLPSLNRGQLEAQRGQGIFEKSISTLRLLNERGYGLEESGLELNLVANATGAFLPLPQTQAERRFRVELQKKWGITFNHLYTFANAPLGRFRRWLELTENLESYLGKLASSFNPCTIEGLMCRNMLSVSWEGYLFDCDFNLAKGLSLGSKKVHIGEIDSPPPAGSPIAVADHCYACTAGSGFT
jgi:radical SAM/Cys-rich protein